MKGGKDWYAAEMLSHTGKPANECLCQSIFSIRVQSSDRIHSTDVRLITIHSKLQVHGHKM